MKIILCTFLLCITAVSVFGKSQELNGIVGKSTEFKYAVKANGGLIYSSEAIGDVIKGTFKTLIKYKGRVHWDSSTGHFSLSGLSLEDSGIYTVENTDGQSSVSTFNLTVWKDNVPVSKPHVGVTHDKYPCTIECTAERGTGVTLSWYREGQKKPYVTSPVRSAPHLDLPQIVESGTYTCEARNSVSRETSDPHTVGADCTAVSVFGEPQELNGIVGKNIEFKYAVKTGGNLIYSSKAEKVVHIGVVPSGRFTGAHNKKFIGHVLGGELLSLTAPEYNGRVHWDSSTGHFSLSELRLNDSGVYTVEKDDGQKSVSNFSLTVWIPVSKPHVSITHNEYPCTIECTAERGTGVTLSWYREGEKKPYISSRVESAPHLHLPETVERSGTYTCEAKNSVSNETSEPLTVGPLCTAPSSSNTGTIVAIFIAVVVAVFNAVVFAALYRRLRGLSKGKNKLGIEEGDPTHLRDDQS